MADSIVRSLLVNVGFVTDRKSVAQTDRAIAGVKTRFALTASAIALAGSQVINFLNSLSANAKNIDNLSRSLGISVNELLAMEKAASNIGIDAGSFQNVLRITDALFQDFRQGGSRLREFARGLRIEIDPKGNAQDALNAILNGLRNIENEQDRIAVAREYFPGLGVQVSDLAKDFDQFNASTQEFLKSQGDISSVVDGLKEYDKAITSIGNSITAFTQNFVVTFAPALRGIADLLSSITDLYGGLISKDGNKIAGALKKGSEVIDRVDPGVIPAVRGFFTTVGTELNRDFTESESPLARIPYNAPGGAANMTNNIDITVPPGTTEEQANFISESIINAIDDRIFSTFMNIQSNNPVVE